MIIKYNQLMADVLQLANQYQKKDEREHILDAPDTYIGSVEQVDKQVYTIKDGCGISLVDTDKIVDGLYKIFDEALVNARDHATRMKTLIDQPNNHQVTYIDVALNDDGSICVVNDGNGIDIAKHPEHNLWIPEMIFAHLRTSTNYKKGEKRIVGGKNGFGVKLAFIWSEWGYVETIDHTRKLKYHQNFKNNLSIIEPPTITKCSNKPYTKIVFKPDYQRFGLTGLSTIMYDLFKRRIYDIAAVTDKSVKVKFDSQIIPIKSFLQYVDLYIGKKDDTPRVAESANDRWEYCVALSKTHEFQQVSFVNGIFTSKGGKHIDYILNQILRKLCAYIKSKKKIDVKQTAIKEQLFLFVRCDIENPAFDSQTKDFMNTPSTKFGSSCNVSDSFIEKLAKMGVMQAACAISEIKDSKVAAKTDGRQSKNIRGIPKLTDANFAGTKKGSECSLIFCEGDSAKAGIMSGLSTDDRNYFGIYPMRGKLFNVRGERRDKISENKEISEIKQILGLVTGKTYADQDDVKNNLRYGRIIFMTDQDLDGSHIKGLAINLFEFEWASLSCVPGFMCFMNTPILKAHKGGQIRIFYNDGDYNAWKEQEDVATWKIKYYKGLGTSTGKEFKEYFAEKKFITLTHEGESTTNVIDMVFNKKRPDDRKDWLGKYNRLLYLDTNKSSISVDEFVHRDLIHYSKYDCDRSIPNLMDGFKISLRKIMFSAFKKPLTKEVKVAQLSGYVSEHSGYHHGEASLNGAIVGLAQNFIGSNNINLLAPNGQFGTRLQGGKDSASERYIFTLLSSITRCIFPHADDQILEYLNDDGLLVEPVYYAPIIPMILVNGSDGIGTGFSTKILSYNPIEIINWLKLTLTNQSEHAQAMKFVPFYNGFKGTIKEIQTNKFLVRGCYHKVKDNMIQITELPVGTWTNDYKEFIESLLVDNKTSKKEGFVKDYQDMCTDTDINFTITLMPGVIDKLEKHEADYGCSALEKALKLYTTQSTTNMHLFNAKEHLEKYDSVQGILSAYYETRLSLYNTRKKYQIDKYNDELKWLTNKAKYIVENLEGTVDLRRKKQEEINQLLDEKQYDRSDGNFKYLTKMPMDSVTEENVEKLLKEKGNKEQELAMLEAKPITAIWTEELDQLLTEYQKTTTKTTMNKTDESTNKVIKKKPPRKKLML